MYTEDPVYKMAALMDNALCAATQSSWALGRDDTGLSHPLAYQAQLAALMMGDQGQVPQVYNATLVWTQSWRTDCQGVV